ncbi:MAG: hypothetical protein ACRYFS_14235 [Janthinobacterium lividum]
MKNPLIALLICVCFLGFLFSRECQAKPSSVKHHHIYQLMFVPIGLTKPITRLPKCGWQVDKPGNPNPVYKSLHEAGLLLWVSHLPKGTEIQYVKPSCVTATDPEEGVPAFAHICRSRGLIFNDNLPMI